MKRRFKPHHIRTALLAVGLAGCLALSMPVTSQSLSEFTSDGCSLFPDRTLAGHADWCHCCLAHDLAYWRGGTEEERAKADKELMSCVRVASKSESLGTLMFAGVRAGGGPYLNTPYRWGYGWAFGRGYTPLTPDERSLADRLETQYRASNPALQCVK